MRTNQINFKSGFLYHKGAFINPDTIKLIKPYDNKKSETRVIYIDKTADIFKIPVDTFVTAANQAKNSADLVDVSNEQTE